MNGPIVLRDFHYTSCQGNYFNKFRDNKLEGLIEPNYKQVVTQIREAGARGEQEVAIDFQKLMRSTVAANYGWPSNLAADTGRNLAASGPHNAAQHWASMIEEITDRQVTCRADLVEVEVEGGMVRRPRNSPRVLLFAIAMGVLGIFFANGVTNGVNRREMAYGGLFVTGVGLVAQLINSCAPRTINLPARRELHTQITFRIKDDSPLLVKRKVDVVAKSCIGNPRQLWLGAAPEGTVNARHLADCSFVVTLAGQPKELFASRWKMAEHAPLMAEMLAKEDSRFYNSPWKIDVRSINGPAFILFHDYCHSGSIDLSIKNLEEIMNIADVALYFGHDALLAICLNTMMERFLNKEHINDLLGFCATYQDKELVAELQKGCDGWVRNNDLEGHRVYQLQDLPRRKRILAVLPTPPKRSRAEAASALASAAAASGGLDDDSLEHKHDGRDYWVAGSPSPVHSGPSSAAAGLSPAPLSKAARKRQARRVRQLTS